MFDVKNLLCKYLTEIRSVAPDLMASHIEHVLLGISNVPHQGWLGKVSKNTFIHSNKKIELTKQQKELLKDINFRINDELWKPLVQCIVKSLKDGYILRNYSLHKDFGFSEFDKFCGVNSKKWISWNFLRILEYQGIIKKSINFHLKAKKYKYFLLDNDIEYTPLHYKEPMSTDSKGEDVVRNLLINNNYLFSTQETGPKCKKSTRFDFCIKNRFGRNIAIIEVDGEQHHRKIPFWNKSNSSFLEDHSRDLIKNRFCKDRNISLLRIRDNAPHLQYKVLKWLTNLDIDNPTLSFENKFEFNKYGDFKNI